MGGAHLERESPDPRAREAAATDVIVAISRAPVELQRALETILNRAARLCNAQGGSIHTLEGDSHRTLATFGTTTEAPDAYTQEAARQMGLAGLIGRVALAREIIHLPDIREDPEYLPRDAKGLADSRSILGVPLLRGDVVFGVLLLARQIVKPFTTEEIACGRAVAAQAALAIEYARLSEETQDTLQQLAATEEILRILSRSASDSQTVFATIVDRARRLCKADNATLALFKGGRSRVAANSGPFADESAYNTAWADLPLRRERSTITGRILIERATVHIPDLDMEKGSLRRGAVPATGARSVLATPLLRDEEVIGMLLVRRLQAGPFAQRDVRLLETFAQQAIIAIENTRLFSTVRRQSEELSRFLSPQVAALITSEEGARLLDGHRREITAIFCDLRGFTPFSETAEPEEVLGVLREYQTVMGRLITSHGGTLEHFAGDGMMVFFNDPVPVESHECAATRLAIEMQDSFTELAAGWEQRGYVLGLGIGVATGFATLGRIGFEGRYDYGAVGNVVILASRLSTEAKSGQILVSQRVHASLVGEVETLSLGSLTLRGVSRKVPAFEVLRP